MNIAVIGSGGREHALAWRLTQSPLASKVFCLPGNPGTEDLHENVNIDIADIRDVIRFCKQNSIGLVAIGPEDPLAAGMADELTAAGVRAFGPSANAARLEADKWFAKEIMRAQAIPTADARTFTDAAKANEYIESHGAPLVIKAAGLAKGKGVTVAYRVGDAIEAVDRCLNKKEFGEAGARVVIEEFMTGPEVSVLAFVQGGNLFVMEPCQDHKPIDDGNTGPMTGGMGAFCPTPTLTPQLMSQVEREVFIPILDGLRREGITFRGVLYAGMMLTPAGPRVLEFNVRFGDPETQPLMLRLKSDLVELMMAVCDDRLDEVDMQWDPRPAISVVASSRGYPGKYKSGHEITGIEDAERTDSELKVFHAGTARKDGKLVTAGGRVLAVTAIGETLDAAREKAYAGMEKIHFDGMHYRRDIGSFFRPQ